MPRTPCCRCGRRSAPWRQAPPAGPPTSSSRARRSRCAPQVLQPEGELVGRIETLSGEAERRLERLDHRRRRSGHDCIDAPDDRHTIGRDRFQQRSHSSAMLRTSSSIRVTDKSGGHLEKARGRRRRSRSHRGRRTTAYATRGSAGPRRAPRNAAAAPPRAGSPPAAADRSPWIVEMAASSMWSRAPSARSRSACVALAALPVALPTAVAPPDATAASRSRRRTLNSAAAASVKVTAASSPQLGAPRADQADDPGDERRGLARAGARFDEQRLVEAVLDVVTGIGIAQLGRSGCVGAHGEGSSRPLTRSTKGSCDDPRSPAPTTRPCPSCRHR